MKTNAQFDEAWHDLQKARRQENLDEIIAAAERLRHAARLMKLDDEAKQD